MLYDQIDCIENWMYTEDISHVDKANRNQSGNSSRYADILGMNSYGH